MASPLIYLPEQSKNWGSVFSCTAPRPTPPHLCTLSIITPAFHLPAPSLGGCRSPGVSHSLLTGLPPLWGRSGPPLKDPRQSQTHLLFRLSHRPATASPVQGLRCLGCPDSLSLMSPRACRTHAFPPLGSGHWYSFCPISLAHPLT